MNPLKLCSDNFHWSGGINKEDPSVWPDGARLPSKYFFENNECDELENLYALLDLMPVAVDSPM